MGGLSLSRTTNYFARRFCTSRGRTWDSEQQKERYFSAMSQYDPVLDTYKEASKPGTDVEQPKIVHNENSTPLNGQSFPLNRAQLPSNLPSFSEQRPTAYAPPLIPPIQPREPSEQPNTFTPTTEMVIEMAKNREQFVAGKDHQAGVGATDHVIAGESAGLLPSPLSTQREISELVTSVPSSAGMRTSRVVYNVPPKTEPEPPRKKAKKKPTNQVATSKSARHLKKADGEPFWRKDIQYDFLQAVFDDQTKAFTNSFPHCEILASCNEPKLTFCDLYIRTIAELGKCSKILRERLLRNREMGKSVAKVCLLVNSGRLNTTINFVPDMRSLMRTYHSIPSLQADPIYGGSKPLQDTPRIKSILKAVTEVDPPLRSLDHVLQYPPAKKPNVTPTQLIFFMSNTFKPIRFQHDPSDSAVEHPAVTAFLGEGNRFMEFFMNSKIHPANRAKRFLWLMYTYIETSFTEEELKLNPFHPSIINPIELLEDGQVDDFDKDTDYEIQYSEKMYSTRLKCIAEEEHNTLPKRGNKAKKSNVDDYDESFDVHSPDPHGDDFEYHHPAKKQKVADPTPVSSHDLLSDDIDYSQYTLGDDLVDGFEGPVPAHLPQIPIKDLCDIYMAYTDSYPRVPRSYTSAASQQNIAAKSAPYIHQASEDYKLTKTSFEARKAALKEWMRKYFEARKDSGNRLVGIEWERLRYDVLSGVEGFMYRHTAKVLEALQKSVNNSNEEIKIPEMEFLPVYEFDKIGQQADYLCKVLSFCEELYPKVVPAHATTTKMTFDLENEVLKLE